MLGLTERVPAALEDSRVGSNKQHGLLPLLRQSIYSRLAGYEDVNDAERLAVDPAMRHVVGGRATLPKKQAASTSEVGRFETDILSTRENLTRLMNLSGRWIDTVHERKPKVFYHSFQYQAKSWKRSRRVVGGAMLEWAVIQAWNGSRLNPNGKSRISRIGMVLSPKVSM